MTIVKRNGHLQSQFPQLFDDFISRDFFNWGLRNFSNAHAVMPAVNIKETPENYEVEVTAPGYSKDNFKIQLDNNVLSISAEKQENREQDDQPRYVSQEFTIQNFSRTLTLQKEVVDTENIIGSYENGILRLSIPKREEAKQKGPRRIEIS